MQYDGERFLPDECNGEIAVEHYQRYQFSKQFVKNKIVLDAACGEGYGSSLLAEDAIRVYGVDINPEVVEIANEKYGNSRVSYLVGSVAELPFEDDFFDIIISYETIEHISSELQQCFMNEIKRVLKQDGMLLMSTPNKAVYTDLVNANNEFHIKEFYLQEYKDFLKNFFENIEFYYQYPDTAYFITQEKVTNTVRYCGKKSEESRYVIALCSDEKLKYDITTENLVEFDDSMYYFLNRLTHKQSEELLNMKEEAERFQNEQQKAINEQKKYIVHLENDIKKQQVDVIQLENIKKEQQEYILHLESDIGKQQEYVIHLESDIKEQQEYVIHLESDIKKQQGYIDHLEKDIEQLKKHIASLGT